jgi:hypothetical protein
MTREPKKMSIRSISIPKELWIKARKQADDNSQSLSGVIRQLLEQWLADENILVSKKELRQYIRENQEGYN